MAPRDSDAVIVAILLGAGDGARMGGNKARLLIEGEPLALRHARRAREAGCTDVLLVTSPSVAPIFIDAYPEMRVVISTGMDPAASLSMGLAATHDDALVLITPVDVLPAQARTIRALLDAVRENEQQDTVASPRWGGRGGHPIAVRARALARLRTQPEPLRNAIARLHRVRVDVSDSAVITDLDTPEDVMRATGAPPRFYG